MRGETAQPPMGTVPVWLRRWPWWVAGMAVALLAGAATLAVLARNLPVVEGEGSWEGRLVYPLLLIPSPVMGALIAYAAVTVQSFSHRVRTEADLPAVTEVLVSMTAQTMEPAHLGLWLREWDRDS